MSVDHVKKFFGKVEGNETLKTKLLLLSEKSKTSIEEALDDLVQIAAEEGFDFSREDYRDARNEVPDEVSMSKAAVPYDCTAATAWKGHPPDPEGCWAAWGCGVQHPLYGGPHIPKCATRPV